MPQLLEGKTALILGVANKWSLAYAIAQAFRREGATLLLTYQGERLKKPVEELGARTRRGAASSSATSPRTRIWTRLPDTDSANTDGWTRWCTASRSRIARI